MRNRVTEMIENLKAEWRQIAAHPVRSVLTMIGLFLFFATVVAAQALGDQMSGLAAIYLLVSGTASLILLYVVTQGSSSPLENDKLRE